MRRKDRKRLRKYIRWMADEMGLRDWTVSLAPDDFATEGAAADVLCLYGRKYLTIRLNRDFAERRLEQQRHWITHELVHAHLWSLDFTLNNASDHLPTAAFDLLQKCVNDNVEFAVDALAEVIAPHMPLPKSIQPKKKRKSKEAP